MRHTGRIKMARSTALRKGFKGFWNYPLIMKAGEPIRVRDFPEFIGIMLTFISIPVLFIAYLVAFGDNEDLNTHVLRTQFCEEYSPACNQSPEG